MVGEGVVLQGEAAEMRWDLDLFLLFALAAEEGGRQRGNGTKRNNVKWKQKDG